MRRGRVLLPPRRRSVRRGGRPASRGILVARWPVTSGLRNGWTSLVKTGGVSYADSPRNIRDQGAWEPSGIHAQVGGRGDLHCLFPHILPGCFQGSDKIPGVD